MIRSSQRGRNGRGGRKRGRRVSAAVRNAPMSVVRLSAAVAAAPAFRAAGFELYVKCGISSKALLGQIGCGKGASRVLSDYVCRGKQFG